MVLPDTTADAPYPIWYPAAASYLSLSPGSLVRGDIARGVPLQIADGYHRVCASYRLDEDTDIPCLIVGLPEPH